jgi:hypothetical protein
MDVRQIQKDECRNSNVEEITKDERFTAKGMPLAHSSFEYRKSLVI